MDSNMKVDTVILAAGEGTRMVSERPKVLHTILGKPMIGYVLDAVSPFSGRRLVVVGKGAHEVRRQLEGKVLFIEQPERRGTGDAVRYALPQVEAPFTLVVPGDMPLVSQESLGRLFEAMRGGEAAMALLTTVVENPHGYGRIVREGDSVAAIVEEAEASEEIKAIREINLGIYLFETDFLKEAVEQISPSAVKGEYYLTDTVAIARQMGRRVVAERALHPWEGQGINNRVDLAKAEELMRSRVLENLMLRGVTIVMPKTVYVEPQVEVGADTTIHPGAFLEGKTKVGRNCTIGMGVHLKDTVVGDGAKVLDYSVLEESVVESNAQVGPFARIRPGTVIGEKAKVGNFVEMKKTRFGKGAKASHLSYVGDAVVGEDVNIGAGTITCNYDGFSKHQTVIEKGAFIGSDTQLVAPVKVGENALVGAGSTITKNVPANSLALTRAPQRVREGKGMLFQARRRGKK